MNSQALTNLYGGLPSFEGAELIEIKFNRDGPAVEVRLIISEKPAKQPAKWPKNYDVVYISLSYGAVKDLSVSHWGTKNIIKKAICVSLQDREGLSVLLDNSCRLDFTYDWARVEEMTYGLIGSA
ncbi:Imm50 family immunity protein [Pseudomonas sp. NPDC089401]|uniref:Imm50 family immunity protein n=1 Tax=Pseudomonas sp. NPDC089401 TaxID=3364462 RepID=UPI00380B1C06